MTSTEFVNELHKISGDKAKMAHLRRVFCTNPIKGLAVLAGMGVPVSDQAMTLPYAAVAWAFAQHGPSTSSVNFGRSLSAGMPGGGPEGKPFDRRFDALVGCRYLGVLVRTHLVRAVQQLPAQQGVNYPLLLDDLRSWGPTVVNRWIEGYYTP